MNAPQAAMSADAIAVLATMATPAVLLLANAMLILSTLQRLQAILERVRETELTIVGVDAARETADPSLLNELLASHAKRARYAHRALLSFYGSAGMFMVVIVTLGISALGLEYALKTALISAFVGSALLFTGAVLLIVETLIGIRALDRRFQVVLALCRQLLGPKERETGKG